MSSTKDLPKLPRQWQLQTKLPCASLCGFRIPPRISRSLMNEGRTLSLLDLYLALTNQSDDGALDRLVRTQHETSELRRSYLNFYEQLLQRRRGRQESDTIAWILPNAYLMDGDRIASNWQAEIESQLSRHLGSKEWTRFGSEYQAWLPYLSLGNINLMRRWRTPRLNAIRRAIFRLSQTMQEDCDAHYPWEPTFSRATAAVPIQALWQFEPVKPVHGAIATLHEFGFTQIRDLKCLHPDAVKLAKRASARQALLQFYRELNRST